VFATQYYLTTVASPLEGGSVTGGGWYTSGATATLNAVPASGYRLVSWSSSPAVTTNANSATVSVGDQPLTVIANFAPVGATPPNSYAISPIATSGTGRDINNFGQVAASSSTSALLWTPMSANGVGGNLTDIGGLPLLDGTNSAFGINDQGQVVGISWSGYAGQQAFLWSPGTPHGDTGNITALPPDPYGFAYGITINSSGQIGAGQDSAGFIWTPITPNGTSGTAYTDSRLAGLVAINDFGQAIMSPIGQQPSLFTPAVANGATGTFSSIPGLPAAQGNQVIAINRNGVILGQSCFNAGTEVCSYHGFLWTPATANGTTGATVEIPLPTGYTSMIPLALNSGGQVVGTMSVMSFDYTNTPFLYSGGRVYDLTTLSSQLAVGSATAINDVGQIVVNAGGVMYLVTPAIPPAPGAGTVAVTIASKGTLQTFTAGGMGCGAGTYNTPQTLYWTPGANCTVTFLSPHTTQIGTRYTFGGWVDGPVDNPRIFTVPPLTTTYTANFSTQYFVTVTANPAKGGTVSGGGWYASGASATLTATPAAGYRLVNWTGSITATAASVTTTVNSPLSMQANFALVTAAVPNSYQVSQIASHATASLARPINNFGQITGTSSSSAFLWTPATANATVGSMTDLGSVTAGATASNAVGVNDLGQVIGATGAYVDGYYDGQLFLWSPDTPNDTTGTGTMFLGTAANSGVTVFDINSYGQIAGMQNFSGFLWTPSQPNGSTGTLYDAGSDLANISRINSFGQALSGWALFTPLVPNGGPGSYTMVNGPSGRANVQLIDINAAGVIVGTDCTPVASTGACNKQTYLWTPTAPNGTTGTAAEIPLAGAVEMTPTALNAAGQVVGSMTRADGVTVPFLYTGGAAYDLSILDSQLSAGSPAGINDHGQIVINANSAVYLLTPGAAPPAPAQGSVAVTITAGTALQDFTVTGSGCSAGGYVTPQTLYWTPGASCTVTFVSPHSTCIGTRFLFTGWNDGLTTNPRVFTGPTQPATYTASYSTQYLLTTVANPPAGGAVSGGGWYAPGTQVAVTATAAAGYRLVGWTPSSTGAAGANTVTVGMGGPETITATFGPISVAPGNGYQAVQIVAYGAATAINNMGQVVGSTGTPFLWTPVIPNTGIGNLTQVVGLAGAGAYDLVTGINDHGQVAGTISTGQPFLWSPTMPNGSSGSAVAVLGADDSYFARVTLNNFGQVTGQGGFTFLWTPSAANGTTGSLDTDPRLEGLWAINDFGQAIINSGLNNSLFTPTVAHGSSGTFSTVSGLAGATATNLVAINESGMMFGVSSIPTGSGSQWSYHAFLWTPASPNGTTGTAVEIPLPTGVVSIGPLALNASGQVVGIMTEADGDTTPFLYSGGTVYDLSTVSTQLTGGTPVAINNAGQIVINAGAAAAAYLLTPATPPPAPQAVSPGSGTGFSQTMTFTFSDARGWQDLDVVNILINNFLDGRNACYLAYSRPQNVLYLVNDAGTALLPGVVLSGAGGSTSNGQCSVTASGAPSGSGDTLTLMLAVTFSASFAGNKVIYLAARDASQNNSGWQAMGTWGVPGGSTGPTAATGVNPAQGSGSSQTFTFTFTDSKGWQDLGVVNILINNALDGRSGCYLAYSRPFSVLYLVNDAGTALLPGLILGSAGSVSNSQCSIAAAGSSASGSGNTLTVTLNVSFAAGFDGNQVIYIAARDNLDVNTSGWQPMGSWTVQ